MYESGVFIIGFTAGLLLSRPYWAFIMGMTATTVEPSNNRTRTKRVRRRTARRATTNKIRRNK